MSAIFLTAPCCGDIEVSETDLVVAVVETESHGTILCQCVECRTEFIQDIKPQVVKLLVASGVRLHINADLGDPEVRSRLFDGETIIDTLTELSRKQDMREPYCLTDLGDIDPAYLRPHGESALGDINNI